MVIRRGMSNLGCLMGILLLAAFIVVGLPVGKVYMRAYEYEDAMRQTLLHGKTDDDDGLRASMRASADSIGDLPEEAYDVDVTRENGMIGLRAAYTDTIRIPVMPRAVTHRFDVERPE